MASDITQAFGHPELRAFAIGAGGLADRISLRDHIVTVEIGAFQQERGTTQRVSFNIVVEVATHDGASDDDVDKILSYDTLTEAIAFELAAERLNLLETLAERIARRILAEPQANRCFIRIEKLDRGPGAFGVEIVRDQSDIRQAGQNETALAPIVVYLSPQAQSSPHLLGWISQLAEMPVPAVICVDLPPGARPQTDHPKAQNRIDLLALEQNAWVLAGVDPRCVVVQSRTELDWAAKNGHLTVWAPSKIVLDSVDRAPFGVSHGPALAVWFAQQVGAQSVVLVGGSTSDSGALAVQLHSPDNPIFSLP